MSRLRDAASAALLAGLLLCCGCSSPATSSRTTLAGSHDDGVRLAPDPPFATSSLTTVFDDEQIDPSRCRYEWQRNGEPIPNATEPTLQPDKFRRGDRISVLVKTPVGSDGRVRTLSAEVHVANSPPSLSRVSLMAADSPSGVVLQANHEATDPDGDALNYEYRWFRNSRRMPDTSGPSIPIGAVGRNDQLTVEVVASDGELHSTSVRSDPLALENHPPQFTSQPTAPLAGDATYRYQVTATDVDGDALSYELVGAPAGMSISALGLVDWTMPERKDRRGEYTVGVRVRDSRGGEATQNFTLRLDMPAK